MKVDLIRKFKWYIVGFILVAIMLSVSLSFSAWDTLSFKAIMNAKGGDFTEKPDTKYELATADDVNKNGIADVGDIVTFGNYYQDANTSTKSAIRWIVVEKKNEVLTLLAESVMAFGSFWGTQYHNGSGWVDGANSQRYQNYSQSTVRAWLNSSARNDDGTAIFSGSTQGVQFKGFMSEAFTADEQTYILTKQISDMKGYPKEGNTHRNDESTDVADKVWIPSWSEVYGTTMTPTKWGKPPVGDYNTMDGADAQFSYFKDTKYEESNTRLVGKSTAFAATPSMSNYTYTGISHQANSQSVGAGSPVWWWLRSSTPLGYGNSLMVHTDGSGYYAYTYHSFGGVRPAVCVPLLAE